MLKGTEKEGPPRKKLRSYVDSGISRALCSDCEVKLPLKFINIRKYLSNPDNVNCSDITNRK